MSHVLDKILAKLSFESFTTFLENTFIRNKPKNKSRIITKHNLIPFLIPIAYSLGPAAILPPDDSVNGQLSRTRENCELNGLILQ